jgi:hypothetical protein
VRRFAAAGGNVPPGTPEGAPILLSQGTTGAFGVTIVAAPALDGRVLTLNAQGTAGSIVSHQLRCPL